MAEYPAILFPDPITRSIQTALPTGRFRIEFVEPLEPDQIHEEIEGAVPLFDGPTLAADYEFPTEGMPTIEEVRERAAASDAVGRILPFYSVDGHEFLPLPDSLTIRAETQEAADTFAAEITEETQELLGDDTYALGEPEEFLPGFYVFEVIGMPKESGFAILAHVRSHRRGPELAYIDAAHSAGRFENAMCATYINDYTDRYDPPPSNSQPLTRVGVVAVLDSFFELDHPALNFQRSIDGEVRGITTVNGSRCAVTAHGTSCAGVIGAFGPEAEQAGAEGAFPGVGLVPVRVWEEGLEEFAELALAAGIKAAVDVGVGVISVGLATPVLANPAVGEAVKYAAEADVVVVVGSGNNVGEPGENTNPYADKPIEYPSRFRSVVAVGAATLDAGGTPTLSRSTNQPAISGTRRWSSKFGVPPPVSTYRIGVSVVAQGTDIATTDLLYPPDPIDPVVSGSPVRFWKSFRATSASGPIVAGLAAKLRTQQGLSAAEVRARIECLADQPGSFIATQAFPIEGYGTRNYSKELGFGWIARSMENLDCEPPPDQEPELNEPTDRGMDMPNEDSPVTSDDCSSVECAGLPDKPYSDLVAGCAQPLSVFLTAITDRRCCDLLYDFLEEPYITARTAGVPYAGAVWLGNGDWEQVNRALMAEQGLVEANVAAIYTALGPIWVKAT